MALNESSDVPIIRATEQIAFPALCAIHGRPPVAKQSLVLVRRTRLQPYIRPFTKALNAFGPDGNPLVDALSIMRTI
jgi:hypothetical protein